MNLFGLGRQKPHHYREMVQDRVGEPRPAAVRLAHPERRRVRRLRARHVGPVGLDAAGHASLHGAPRADAAEHGAGARSRPCSPTWRTLADAIVARAARARPPAGADAAAARRARLPRRSPGTRRSIASPRELRGDRSAAARVLSDVARHHQRGLLRRAEGGALLRHQPRRQLRAPVPRGVDRGDEGDARLRRLDLQLRRLARRRPDRPVRLERRRTTSR